jgi:hypothetical protein
MHRRKLKTASRSLAGIYGRVFALLCALVVATPALARTTLYDAGGFESSAGYSTLTTNASVVGNLRGQGSPEAWFESSTAGTGTDLIGSGPGTAVVESKAGGSGSDTQDVVVTRTQYDDRWAPVIDYPASSSPNYIVNISWDMSVSPTLTDPDNYGPFFGIEANDASSGPIKQIGALGVDATTGEVLIYDSNGIDITPDDTVVNFNQYNSFLMTMNFQTDTYDVTVNGSTLETGIPFISSGVSELTDADIAALQAAVTEQANQSGTAYFDNYLITAVPEPGTLALIAICAIGAAKRRGRRAKT